MLGIDRNLPDDVLRELVREICHDYFQGGSAGFLMARRLKEEIERKDCRILKDQIRTMLRELLDIMCDNLRSSSKGGNEAKMCTEVGYWVACEVFIIDPIASVRLMRELGDGLVGKVADQYFWQLRNEIAEAKIHNDWAIQAFAEGFLKKERPVQILSDHLIAAGRGPVDQSE
jgi:hypothetical protein